MGNSKSSSCMPLCGEKESDVSAPSRSKYQKFKKPVEAKKSIKKLIAQESYERYMDVKVRGGFENDVCRTYLQSITASPTWKSSS